MRADLNERLTHAKNQLERWKDLKASLPSAQERLNQETFRLRQLEVCLDQVQEQLGSLESFSLSGLIEGLMGRKEQRLQQCREELAAMQAERDEVTEGLLQLDAQVREIEQQLVGLGDPQRALQELCDEKQAELLETDCEAAERLRELMAELETFKGQRRQLQKAVQIGKHLIERLESMASSLGRSKGKMMYGGPLGAVGNSVMNTVMRQGSNALVARMHEKLTEFAQCVQGLDLSEATDLELEIARLGAVVAGMAQDLAGDKLSCDPAAALPIVEQVSPTIGLLEAKLARLEPHLKQLEDQRLALVEQV